MLVMGVESSCDESGIAIVDDGRRIVVDLVASQIDIHARYGGVVPEVASRQHLLAFVPLLEEAFRRTGLAWSDLGGIAVTRGPGLAGALLVGVNIAKSLAFARSLPLVGINHLEGHLYAGWLWDGLGSPPEPPSFPLLALIVSGGHTGLLLMRDHGDYRWLGETRDDAAGEAFDKAARLLGLGFPGGPAIQRIAEGARAGVHLPRAWLRGSYDFSFSGLKTAVLHLAEREVLVDASPEERARQVTRMAAGFQDAVVDVLVTKTIEAARQHQVRHILLAGGVAANRRLREEMVRRAPAPVLIPHPSLCTDNGAMVAACGYFRLQAGQRDGWGMDVVPDLRLS
ncbi:MAG: tRNA (adenosine(37)-N6)-threonylcarbamoyltransferase complex transferase subunit TsaD [Chloroflexi bacterium]|nr:tRNA (adenosine(37)-N6)-threonylcarbamoyltransferase complex transferase subunit TsaD [Chloroflexota bacterium]